MIKITLHKSVNVRSGEMPLRFRLRDGASVDLTVDTGKMVGAKDMQSFAADGMVRPDLNDYNRGLADQIGLYKKAIAEAYFSMLSSGEEITDASLKLSVDERLKNSTEDSESEPESLVGRFRLYLEEERASGRFSDKMYRESMTLSRKLERYLVIREHQGLKPASFSPEMVVDFEKFCIHEYLYASNPKYAALYPKTYEECRYWPKHKLKEEPLRKVLIHFQTFWQDLVSFGEVEASPYDNYLPWMQEKKYARYSEMIGDPLSLTMDEFQQVLATPVPESMAGTRNAFILQLCLGCRGEDFKNLSFENVAVSKKGIPYIYYTHKAIRKKEKNEYDYEIRVPLVRVAFDIVMRTRFNFFFGKQNASYNREIGNFLRHCGITREICLYNTRTGEAEYVELCDAIRQGHLHRIHMDLVHDAEDLRGLRGEGYTGARVMERMKKVPLEDHLWILNWAFGQKPFRVDENLRIVEGLPFSMRDDMIYKEQLEKLPGGSTNPYLIASLSPLPRGEGKPADRIKLQYIPVLVRERPVLVLGEQFEQFLDSLEERHRVLILYGILLLRRLSVFEVGFVKNLKGNIYALRTALRGYVYQIVFYVNGEAIVLMHCRLTEKHKRKVSEGKIDLKDLEKQRWNHVTGVVEARDYGVVLDGLFGSVGTPFRQKSWAKACSSYVSQALRKARIDANMMQEEIYSLWGLKDDCGNLAHAENGTRVLPFKYLGRLLDALGQKAVITRPVVEDGCNYDEIVSQLMLDAAVHAPEKRNRRRPKMGLLADKLVKEETSAE